MTKANNTKQPINRAIRLLLIKVMLLSFVLIYGLLVIQEINESVEEEQEHISMLAGVIASNVQASLLFNDADSAKQTLNSLASSSSIRYATLTNNDGDEIATFGSNDFAHYFWNNIEHYEIVMFDDEKLGGLFIVNSLAAMWQGIRNELITLAIVFVLVLLIAAMMSRKLATTIIQPIQNLVATSREISHTGRYDLRTQKISDDEVGELADTFNLMLSLIEKRDDELRVAATTFNSREAILITDQDKKIIKVNPAFTELTGYSLLDVQGNPPAYLCSKNDDNALYQQIINSLNQTGHWAGELVDEYRDGHRYHGNYIITVVRNSADTISHYVISFTDISERIAAQEKIKELAFYDALTHLPNRRLLIERLTLALKSSVRSQQYGALFFLDLDKFKLLNDTKGHSYGDLLLIEVANRLLDTMRAEDSVARFGGDEFVVMLEELGSDLESASDYANMIGQKIVVELNQPYELSGYSHTLSTSIGITLFHGNERDVESILIQADTAMYSAKNAGRNTLRFFDTTMQQSIEEKNRNEQELRQAIEQQQFELFYQALVNAKGEIIGAEALIRWQHPERGMLMPDQFIPLAEELGLIERIGDWVIMSACQQLKYWQQFSHTQSLILAINISVVEFRQVDFVDNLLAALDEFEVNPQQLNIELTESVILHDVDFAIRQLARLKEAGVATAMDDFGTGYSSLNYLSRLPISIVKIDRSFVARMNESEHDKSIVKMIVAFGKMLNMDIVAEGVEIKQQYEFLKTMDCHYYQGYFFGKPIPVKAFEELLGNSAKIAGF